MQKEASYSLIGELIREIEELQSQIEVKKRKSQRELLGWCPEHSFVVATLPASMTTAPWHFSCGCPYTKARVVTYREAIDIVKGIRHARNSAKFKRESVHINVVQYDGPNEEFESYCRQVKEIFQMEEVRR